MTVRNVDIARALGADQSLVGRWVRRGMPTTSVEAALTWHAANVRTKVRVLGGDAPSGSPHQPGLPVEAHAAPSPSRSTMMQAMLAARLERERADAARASMQTRQLAGELVSAADVRAALAKRLAAAREYLLQIPARLAPVLAAETDQAACARLLEDELLRVLAIIAGEVEG